LVQYSNDDEKTIVEDAGKDACTICYPSAPADVLNRASRIVTADKIAKAQAKAERDAKKEAKIAKEKANAPTASGESLYFKDGKYTEEIKTERSAVSRWLDNQYWILNSSNPEQQQSKKQVNYIICESLAVKYEIAVAEQEAILKQKYAKRG
jgi:galactose-1-phosphate uridylyltransferase